MTLFKYAARVDDGGYLPPQAAVTVLQTKKDDSVWRHPVALNFRAEDVSGWHCAHCRASLFVLCRLLIFLSFFNLQHISCASFSSSVCVTDPSMCCRLPRLTSQDEAILASS